MMVINGVTVTILYNFLEGLISPSPRDEANLDWQRFLLALQIKIARK